MTARLSSITALIGVIAIVATAGLPAEGGDLRLAGSTTVLPLSQIWAEEYMAKHHDASISVSGGGSGTGLSMLLNGTCDIANASRAAKSKEIASAKARNSKLTQHKVAKDGIAMIVHPSNDIKGLTIAQLAAIYSGKAKTWNKVGGKSSSAIVAVGRDSSSGTYGFFQQAVLGGKPYRRDMLGMASNAAVAQAVAQSKYSIGYVGMAYAEQYEKKGKVKTLYISRKAGEQGMQPTEETVRSGKYPLFRYLYCYTLGNPRGLAGQFLKWCLGSEGQSLVKTAGYVSVK